MRFSRSILLVVALVSLPAMAEELPEFLDPKNNPDAYQSGLTAGQSALDRAVLQHKKKAREYGQEAEAPVYLLVSTSMPEGVLENYYLDAREHDRPVVFVVRGFEPQEIQAVIKPFYEISEGRMDVPVEVNPVLFRDLDVELVPAAVAQDGEGAWRVARGDASLAALLKAVNENDTAQPLGRRYKISEPDLLEVIETRIEAVDWQAKRKRLADQLVDKITDHDMDVPVATKKRVDWVDPSVTANRDITNPEDGRVLIPAGHQANPLEHLSLQRAYVVFDPTDPAQRAVVRDWRDEHGDLGMIATRYPPDPEALEALSEKLGGPLMQANDLLIRRLNVREVPALIMQDGKTIKVVTVPPPDPEERS